MAEWTIAPALKAGVGKLTEGSNPSASVSHTVLGDPVMKRTR
jgi:hypothetical protein